MKDRKYILIGGEHYNPLGLVRSLGVEGIKPIAIIKKADYGVTSKSKYISKLHLVNTNEEVLNLLIEQYGNESEKPFLFTCDDQMASMLDMNYNELKEKFIFFNANEQGRISKYMKKDEIMKLATKHGLKVAKSWKVNNKIIPSDLTYPVLTKALISTKDNWKEDSFICKNETELREALEKIKTNEILIQEYIIKKNELCYDGYSCDNGKKVLYAISSDYLYVKDGAYSNYMLVSNNHHSELETKLNKMFQEIQYDGIFSVEFLVDENDNYYFLEINFRNSTWSWAATVAGMNLPVLWSKSMLDSSVFENAYKSFKPFKAMVEMLDFQDRVKTKKIGIIKWLFELFSAKVKYYWYARDIKPVLSKVLHKLNKKHY